jgi:glycerate kinase
MAQASGLTLIAKNKRDPLVASTYGTGQMILDALNRGSRAFILGIGGSATNDGGAGMAEALGFRFLDEKGAPLPRGGGALLRLATIDASGADPRLAECRFTVACDVDNPLLGPRGASAVFGPQKGATPEMVEILDRALARYAVCMQGYLRKGAPDSSVVDISQIPGAGAAGGLGAGSIAFLGAELKKGVDIVISATGLEEKIRGAVLAITGEGCTDSQTLGGKTVYGIARLAKSLGVPVIVISGSVLPGAEALLGCGVVKLYSLMDGNVTFEESIRDSAKLLSRRTATAVIEFFEHNRGSTCEVKS